MGEAKQAAAQHVVRVLLLLTLAGASNAASITDLHWLAGHWQSGSGDQRQSETWIVASPTLMIGSNIGVNGTKTTFEYLRIEQRGDELVYFASPGGAPATAFKLVEVGERFVAFANPEHDFPQRIEYRGDGDELTAIASNNGGQQLNFSWQRQPSIPVRMR